jgi:Secretion system C-terminal sorting domain
MPSTLLDLQCYGGQFTNLPTLPSGLQTLNCGDGNLTTLPTLPNTLTTLFCYNNRLPILPTLPASLTWLACSNNLLPTLPTLPTGMKKLFCGLNPLMRLQPLPTTLTHLACNGNQLTQLPTLPMTLKILYCYDNQLTILPTLPGSLTDLIMDASIVCIPNQVVGLTIYDKDNRILTRPTCPPIGIELFSFTVKRKDATAELTWQTASDINTSHFDIQQSSDGVRFRHIGQQKAATYHFTDLSLLLPITYYRLAVRDLDGTTTFSKIVSVAVKGNNKLKAYPNPVSNVLTVETDNAGSFEIVNILGQQVITGKAAQRINVSELVQGTYILKVGTEQVKFVKQ